MTRAAALGALAMLACGRLGFDGSGHDAASADGAGGPDGPTGDASLTSCVQPPQSDDFNEAFPCTGWGNTQVVNASMTTSSGILTMLPNPATANAHASCSRTVPMTGAGALVNVQQVLTGSGAITALQLDAGSQHIELGVRDETIYATTDLGATVSTGYSAPAMQWWRILPDGGQVVFQTSADGMTWTPFASIGHGVAASVAVQILASEPIPDSNVGAAKFGSIDLCP